MGLDIFSLEGKVALVTGSGRHIGKAIALGMAECGADIISVARTAAEIEQTAAEVRAMGRKAIAIPANVRESQPVNEMVEKAIREFGKIDILVNNVGGTFPHKILEVSERAWDALISLNLRTTFLCTQAVGKAMRDKDIKGCIINISSTEGYGPSPNGPAYGAAKAAIVHFTQSCAVDLGQYGIRVNTVMYGLIVHDTNIPILGLDKPGVLETMAKSVPLGRLGALDDVAGPCIFLASEAAQYVSGTTIIVSGGQL
jgi:NAD(P)-dependent dehydrogenase (short-subunit alcohol dehydrogenase family)